jgi:L-threonylcarbamoyladenylate synthase
MKLIDRSYVESHKSEIVEAIRSGAIFIYPTDTIYGLGTNALLNERVEKVREIKNRDTKPLLVIAPNKEWLEENCTVSRQDIDKYLPGSYSLFVHRKKDCVAQSVNPSDDSLGVRMIDHWFMNLVSEAGVPFVTTSVNISGEPWMQKLEDVPESILSQVDYVIYEGEILGQPSQKLNLL